jgi:coproporphyrinogen III oxidase
MTPLFTSFNGVNMTMRITVLLCLAVGSGSLSLVTAFISSLSIVRGVPSGIRGSALFDERTGEAPPELFDEFVAFLVSQQGAIVNEIEETIELTSGATFGTDKWGGFAWDEHTPTSDLPSGGITRVIQGGDSIEKGACSLTLIRNGKLTAERAATIRGRQASDRTAATVQAGDTYSAVALSMVLHSRSPMVPTFRSDVRVFLVTEKGSESSLAWFGGGADLTPYYLFPEDIKFFHQLYQQLCVNYTLPEPFSYETMKTACDHYFFLPARQEHRGTGGIFFDDMPMTRETLEFSKGVTHTWMPSWLPIVTKRYSMSYSSREKHWQKLRRGRYLEFNLLYDVSCSSLVT